MLQLENADQFRLYCNACPYVQCITERTTVQVALKRKEVDDVLGGEEAWQNARQTSQALCPKCNGKTAYYMELQTRSADEPSTIYYRCADFSCKTRWNEN